MGLPVPVHILDGIFLEGYIRRMSWDVEYTDEFGDWWASLTEAEQVSLAASVQLLEARGPSLGHPHSSGINGSRHGTCVNSERSMPDALTARFMPLTLVVWRFC
jgi:hypothetical protein